ncbi:MAG: ABC transporter substrate-binding protein [Bradyrhizobium sp.]|uniref:ABC transporter substrate-binding protein n=1 Tax=Bradyrhizobium sp. TaxID=376 RepID=UPI0012093095|nr:ABC transporter substrate-binding protein [Bradyrhizobium sp.]THD63388.1 MAG: ABC transporter substrate-binding protein [Bradyrhizobium sp.]
MKRRQFMTLLGGAAAWPLAVRAQQTMPVIGYLSSGAPDKTTDPMQAFRRGLSEAGYDEGRNVAIEYRWGDGYGGLVEMASDLVQRKVAAIVAAGGVPSAQAAKAATSTIPIIFAVGGDPVAFGIVSSLNRPSGNITGVTNFNLELGQKRLELLHEMMPGARRIGLLVNPATALADPLSDDARAAAQTMGLQLHVLRAANEQEIEKAFAELAALRADALIIGADAYFGSRSQQLASLAARNALAAVGSFRFFARAGGLISYGGSVVDQFHSVGVYTGQVLAGKKPADLPVQQSTRVELAINLKTAKILGLDIPASILARADEVIE